jgi:putative tryptophan/tyrosine transport system substrate-binding protein
LHVSVKAFEAREPDQLKHVIEVIAVEDFGAVVVAQNAIFYDERKRIAEFAVANKLATMAPADGFLPAGALMSYGPVWSAIFRNAAGHVDKILRAQNRQSFRYSYQPNFGLLSI